MTFTGFPVAALDFYDDLEVDNTKSFWEGHKATYAEAVKAPMEALTAELAGEFGRAKIFRPYREVAFVANVPSAPRTNPIIATTYLIARRWRNGPLGI